MCICIYGTCDTAHFLILGYAQLNSLRLCQLFSFVRYAPTNVKLPPPPPPPPYRAAEISGDGDLILFDVEYSLGPGKFAYIRAFDVKFYTV